MSERIRTLIVDDEPLAREGIRLHLADEPDIEIVGERADGAAAVKAIEELDPDLVFLDIQMPGLNGFDVLEAIGVNEIPVVIFVTAYDEFALRAFDAHALDYLLKPFDADRFQRALQRAREQLLHRQRASLEDRLRQLLEDLHNRHQYVERLVVRSQGRILILRVEDVDWIEAAANYVRLHSGGRSYLVRDTMNGIEQRLDPRHFLRIHRSHIIRIDRIRQLEPLFHGDYAVTLHDGTRLQSSRGFRDSLQHLLSNRD